MACLGIQRENCVLGAGGGGGDDRLFSLFDLCLLVERRWRGGVISLLGLPRPSDNTIAPVALR